MTQGERMMRTRRILSLFLLITIISGIFAGCAAKDTSAEGTKTLTDLESSTLGIVTGTSWDIVAQERFPDAERKYFSSSTDVLLALEQGKVDAFFADKTVYSGIRWKNSTITAIDEPVEPSTNALIFAKEGYDENLLAQVNAFIAKSKENGTLDRLSAKWFADTEPNEHPDYTRLSGENGTLRIAICDAHGPLSYQKGTMYTGYEVEFLTLFAEEYGYQLDLQGMAFDAMIPFVASGKCDIGASGITITPERAESVTFSDPHIETYGVAIVRADPADTLGEMALEDFKTAKIGIMTGSSQELIVKEMFPDAERVYFSRQADMVLAVEQGKIDGYMFGSPFLPATIWENANVKRLDEAVSQGDIAFAFPQDTSSDPLREQLNTFIEKAKQDGTIDRLKNKWLGKTEPTEHPDYQSLTGENGTIRLAAVAENKPLIYQYQNQCTGLEMELLTIFAEEYGYRFDIEVVPFDSVIMGMSTGKYDMTSASLQVTAEREESVNFSVPYMQFDVVMVVKGDGTEQADVTQADVTLADLENATIGVITGSAHNGLVEKNFPNAKRLNFTVMADMLLAVQQGKIDCYIEDEPFMTPLLWEEIDVKRVDEAVAQVSSGFVFPQGEVSRELRQQVNTFLAEAKADGTIERLVQKWLGGTEPTEHPAYSQLTGENGTIHLAISVDNKPLLYQNAEGYTGFEMELLTLFGQYAGYAFEIEVVPFESIIAGISAGKYDMASSALNITPEREESVDFSDPYASFDVVMVVKNTEEQKTGKTLAGFENASIGVLTGSVYDDFVKERFPNARREYYSMFSDMIVAVEQGKIDGYLSENTYVTAAIWEGAKIQAIDEAIACTHAGFIFQKGEQSALLREQMNSFIHAAKENGTLDALNKKWFGKTEPTEKLDFDSLTGENGTLKIAVSPDLKPGSYIKDGELTGYEMEILQLFAKEYGYKLDMSYMTFDAILPGVTTGKYDIGTGAVTITEERAQSLDFSESHLTVDVVMVVKEEAGSAVQTSFWDELKEDFHKTFIRENRWKLIVEGIGVTMLISICAAITGSLLGFGLYMLSRADAKVIQVSAKGVAKVYSRMIAGTPVVVILMILFYVIFGKNRDMNGIVVAIIGFTLTFGAFVYDHMTVSVNSVDIGQTEAAYALGYTRNKTFFRIIFPQAMTVFLPSYCGQAVELIKATAVVGYVAVNDLTKMGDIIRSNTYEAFFPLIATAVIYFLLTWMLSALLGLLKRHFEPKRRSAEMILKGVKTK